jgi:hypothetical protein
MADDCWMINWKSYGRKPPCGGRLEYLHCSLASRRRRRKGNPVPGATLSLGGYKYKDMVLQVGGGLQCWRSCSVKYYCCEIQRSANLMVWFTTNLTEFSKEGYGTERAFLPVTTTTTTMTMMMMMKWFWLNLRIIRYLPGATEEDHERPQSG